MEEQVDGLRLVHRSSVCLADRVDSEQRKVGAGANNIVEFFDHAHTPGRRSIKAVHALFKGSFLQTIATDTNPPGF
ncbi:MAG: hypothetical protein BMS9Abin12_1218 [Acidimicrobiia bacterium]|nr:MAG: hypothetical protein BMS9Abin12_1218 [Acidimicrobiia bacterium]